MTVFVCTRGSRPRPTVSLYEAETGWRVHCSEHGYLPVLKPGHPAAERVARDHAHARHGTLFNARGWTS